MFYTNAATGNRVMTRPFFSGKAVFELQTPEGSLRFRIDTQKDTYTLLDPRNDKSITLSSAALAEAYRLMMHMTLPVDGQPEPAMAPVVPSRPLPHEETLALPPPRRAPSIFEPEAPAKKEAGKSRPFFGASDTNNVSHFPQRHCVPWTATEDAIVTAGWVTEGMSIDAFKNRLERTDGAIFRRMVRLGIGATETELRQENSRRLARGQTGNNG